MDQDIRMCECGHRNDSHIGGTKGYCIVPIDVPPDYELPFRYCPCWKFIDELKEE